MSLKSAWEMYKTYTEEAESPVSRMIFKEELKNYFRNYEERFSMGMAPVCSLQRVQNRRRSGSRGKGDLFGLLCSLILYGCDPYFDKACGDCLAAICE